MQNLLTNNFSKYKSYRESKTILLLANSFLRKNIIGVVLIQYLFAIVNLTFTNWFNIFKLSFYVSKKGYKWTIIDAVYCCFKYGTNLKQFYAFRFYKQNEEERSQWLGESMSLYFQRNRSYFDITSTLYYNDKFLFYEKYQEYMRRDTILLSCAKDVENTVEWLMRKKTCIIKPRYGYQGYGIDLIKSNLNADEVRKILNDKLKYGEFVLEELIIQHSQTTKFNPASVNSLRITTFTTQNQVDIIGVVFRMGVGTYFADNISSGGLSAPVDIVSGLVNGPGIAMNTINEIEYEYHPLTNYKIPGFHLPYWKETLELIIKAAKIIPGIKSVGWDVAISETGPVLIEGNSPWGVYIYQLPHKKGRLDVILPYIDRSQLYPVHRKYFKN